jgi:isoaspartyl peptidase/L-asparaginase-like protein (Ntn-hydrolase superfamily)
MEFGITKGAQDSADKAINYLENKVKGLGGLIIIDKNGEYGIVKNK